MLDDKYHLDKGKVRASFDRAAASYDAVAILQREVGARLLERLELIKLIPTRLLDMGCGTGELSGQLTRRFKKADLVCLDLAPAMLTTARRKTGWFSKQRFVCGDAESLPLADDSVDMILSNLTVQWCEDLDAVFRECRRVLRPGGLLMFSTLGPDTLKELRASWEVVDGYSHVNAFIDMHDVGDALIRARLADPVMDVETVQLTYGDVMQLMRDLKLLGAHNITAGRAQGLTGRRRLEALREAYESYRSQGVLPASYEVVYGHAWAPLQKQQAPDEPGTQFFPIDRLRGSRRG